RRSRENAAECVVFASHSSSRQGCLRNGGHHLCLGALPLEDRRTSMFQALKQMFARGEQTPLPAVPPGERVYAVGDIHGRRDLFAALVEAIDADDAGSEPAETTVILLGDLVDRGPDSAGVIALAREWQSRRSVRILGGNHEEMFLRGFDE